MSAPTSSAPRVTIDGTSESSGLEGVLHPPTKTPLFQAIHAARYQRQAMIHRIQEKTGRVLICYMAGSAAPISREDTAGFVDLLHNVHGQVDLDLMLHTPGGDIDAAEKLIALIRSRVTTGFLRTVVPDYAKSAGTLMVLGADAVVMGDGSELGPIDPQVNLTDCNGHRTWQSVQNYLDAFECNAKILRGKPDDPVALLMLSRIDPATIKRCESIRERARVFAEKQLKRGMFRKGGNWSQAASELLDTRRWQSHGQMISWEDAADPRIGLTVEHLPGEDPLWQEYWQLHCLQRLAVGDGQKLYESDFVSIRIEAAR